MNRMRFSLAREKTCRSRRFKGLSWTNMKSFDDGWDHCILFDCNIKGCP